MVDEIPPKRIRLTLKDAFSSETWRSQHSYTDLAKYFSKRVCTRKQSKVWLKNVHSIKLSLAWDKDHRNK